MTGEATLLDGAWWPRSRELSLEVPLLAAEFAKDGTRVTRVIYYPSSWQVAPPKVTVDGRRIHLGWFREIDPHLVSLRTGQDERIELLVIPSETDPADRGASDGPGQQREERALADRGARRRAGRLTERPEQPAQPGWADRDIGPTGDECRVWPAPGQQRRLSSAERARRRRALGPLETQRAGHVTPSSRITHPVTRD